MSLPKPQWTWVGISDMEELHQPFTRTRHELTGEVFQTCNSPAVFLAVIFRENVDPRWPMNGKVEWLAERFPSRQKAKAWVESYLFGF